MSIAEQFRQQGRREGLLEQIESISDIKIISWELDCFIFECLSDHESLNKQLLTIYAQVLQAVKKIAESEIFQDQIDNGIEFPAISTVRLPPEQSNELS